MKNITYQILTIISVLSIIGLFAVIVFKMPSAEDHQPILDMHHKRIDSLIERIELKVNKIDSLEAHIDQLSKKTNESVNNYYNYKIDIDELLKNIPNRNINDLDSLRSILTNIK